MSANSNAIGPDDLSSEFLYMASRSYYQFVIQVTLNNEVGGYLTRREAGKKNRTRNHYTGLGEG